MPKTYKLCELDDGTLFEYCGITYTKIGDVLAWDGRPTETMACNEWAEEESFSPLCEVVVTRFPYKTAANAC